MRFHRPQPLTRRPTVSVVIPCYNYGHYLPAAIRCALDQKDVDVEVIVVDDASPDGSGQVAQALADADPRVEAILHTTNTGHIRTYNDGLAKAKGDYVALVSADDLLTRDCLTRAAALMEAHPRVGFVYGFAASFSGGPPATSSHTRNWTVWKGLDWLSSSARQGRCFIASPEVVMRREALHQTELYDPRLPHSADFDMWMRTAARWDVGRVNGPEQAQYRVHDSNMHLTTYSGWVTDLRERRVTFDILFDERADDLPDVVRLRPSAYRALAREAVRRAGAAGLERPGSAEVEELFAFAKDIWPSVDQRAAWRLATRRRAARSRPLAGVQSFAGQARKHLLWQRERRYGL